MPVNPKRLQVRDRVIALLTAITAGASYFFTTVKVFPKTVLETECPGYPCASVHPDSGGEIAESTSNSYDETFYLSVEGLVKDLDDPGAAVLKWNRDIRKAIDDDHRNGGAGSLATLAVLCEIREPPETDNGFFSGKGFGWFKQRIKFMVTGDIGDL